MSHFGGGLGAGLGGGLHSRGPADLGTGGVRIHSNLLISSGCLSLSGLSLTKGVGGGWGRRWGSGRSWQSLLMGPSMEQVPRDCGPGSWSWTKPSS